MRDPNRAPREDPDKILIDRMIDWRCTNQPGKRVPIQTNLDPKSLYAALGIPCPSDDENETYSDSLVYRGFVILAKTTR